MSLNSLIGLRLPFTAFVLTLILAIFDIAGTKSYKHKGLISPFVAEINESGEAVSFLKTSESPFKSLLASDKSKLAVKTSFGAVLGESTHPTMVQRVFPQSIVGLSPTITPSLTTAPILDQEISPTQTPSLSQTPVPSATVTPSPTPSPLPPTPTPTILPTTTYQTVLTPSQVLAKEVAVNSINFLQQRDFKSLYNLMSKDFKAVFSQTDFISSFSSSVDVVSGYLEGDPSIYGGSSEWAEVQGVLILKDNSKQKYALIFHLENGLWKMFGTEERP